jgi:hypothetical protein
MKCDWAKKLGAAPQFNTWEGALGYTQEKVKTYRDDSDGIEIWQLPASGYEVNNTTNSAGRRWCKEQGAKLVAVQYRDSLVKQHRVVTAATIDDLIPEMEKLGWEQNGESSEWITFRKNNVTIHVKLLQGVIFSWQAIGGDPDPETTKLLDGMT